MTHEELEQIEISNEYAKKAVNKGEALKRLLDNEDYKLIIVDGYMQQYAQDLGTAIATNTGAYDTEKLVENLKGINTFVGYTFRVANAHADALQTLHDNEMFIASKTEQE